MSRDKNPSSQIAIRSRAKTNWEWLTMMVTVTISLVYVLTVQAKPISNDAEVRSAWKV